jgi:hypothetical protein
MQIVIKLPTTINNRLEFRNENGRWVSKAVQGVEVFVIHAALNS